MSQLAKTEAKVQMKDDIIRDMQQKEENYKKIIDAENQKFSVLEGYSKNLERKLKIEKVKNKFKSILGGVVIATLGVFLIMK